MIVPVIQQRSVVARKRLVNWMNYLAVHRMLLAGLLVILGLALIGPIGSFFVDVETSRPLSEWPGESPTMEYPLGTDTQGRNLFAVLVAGLPLTLRVAFLAGSLGLIIGTVLGFTAGYVGGVVDTVIRTASDVLITIPTLLVLVVVAVSIKGLLSIEMMAIAIALLAWMGPARVIRAQVLTLREKAYVDVSRASGMNDIEIMYKELLPNMLPFLAASFVNAVIIAVLSAVGLQALGLGPTDAPTMGMTIHWALEFGAVLAGMWWWWIPPLTVIVVLFMGLYLIATGLDEIANPRIGNSS
jgi:peptide/nickel transport system permease protein